MTIIFRNCTLFDGTEPRVREQMDVLVIGSRIKEVSDRPIKATNAEAIEVGGRTLMPGLIDAHVHATAGDADLGKLDTMPKAIYYLRTREMLEAALERGFTSVRDAGGADYSVALAIESGLIRGPRLFYSGKALTQTGGHGDFRGLEHAVCQCGQGGTTMCTIADGVPAVRAAAREELRRGATQIKIMASGGVASPSDPIWNLQYSEEEIRAAVWEATSWQTYVMAHAYTPEAIRRCVEYGVRSIEHANLIDDETADFVAKNGVFVVPTLVTYDALHKFGRAQGFPKVSLEKLETVRDAGLSSLECLKRAGVKIGLGTDLLGEMRENQSREFSMRADVLSNAEILMSATSINASLLNREGELGVIKPGAIADIIVVDGNPLERIDLLEDWGRNLSVIMKDGVQYKNRLR